MNLTIIGAGYVGLVTGACLSKAGNSVHIIDINKERIDLLNKGISPIFEAGLQDLIRLGMEKKRIDFSLSPESGVKVSDLILLCVNTPPNDDGSPNLSFLQKAVENLMPYLDETKVLVLKSTVPIGTAKKVSDQIFEKRKFHVPIISNPEFLRQGSAVHDFLSPDRVVIGGTCKWAIDLVEELHQPFLPRYSTIIKTDNTSAELIKYAANAFLAAKISFINYCALLADAVGADVRAIREGVAADPRIGPAMLNPGIGYGGSCLPKDLAALTEIARQSDIPTELCEAIANINKRMRYQFIHKVKEHFKGDLKNRRIAMWGLSFKPGTDDIREAPSIEIINELLKHGACLSVYDPEAAKNIRAIFGDRIEYPEFAYEALKDAEALLLVTEWDEFRRPSFAKMRRLMKSAVIFDGRHLYDSERVRQLGFEYYSLGTT